MYEDVKNATSFKNEVFPKFLEEMERRERMKIVSFRVEHRTRGMELKHMAVCEETGEKLSQQALTELFWEWVMEAYQYAINSNFTAGN